MKYEENSINSLLWRVWGIFSGIFLGILPLYLPILSRIFFHGLNSLNIMGSSWNIFSIAQHHGILLKYIFLCFNSLNIMGSSWNIFSIASTPSTSWDPPEICFPLLQLPQHHGILLKYIFHGFNSFSIMGSSLNNFINGYTFLKVCFKIFKYYINVHHMNNKW